MKSDGVLLRLASWVANPYLVAIRDGLTLTLPVIVAGTFAILLNSFPLDSYQAYMVSIFGDNWKLFGGYVYNGTFGVLSVIMALSIGHSLCEDYNARYPLHRLTPSIFSFVIFSCVMVTMEPVALGEAFEIRWLGVHGLLLAILTSLSASFLFRSLLHIDALRITIHSSNNSVSINQALGAMFPAILTISAFAGYKAFLYVNGIPSPNEALYKLLTESFSSLGGQSLWAANFYSFIRHILWFIGIHGSNVLEPIMQEVYVSALSANINLKEAGLADPRSSASIFDLLRESTSYYAIVTKPFFDCYTSMGGAGSTFGLLIACLLKHKDASARKIARISILPSIFNINEILLFGLPVVLNPTFLIPFVVVPLVNTTIAYFAIYLGLVPPTANEVAWNIPIFINGYMATGSLSGVVLQVVNLSLATLIYMPFVRIDNELREKSFKKNFQSLVDAAIEGVTVNNTPKLISMPNPVGNLATSLALDLRHAVRNNEFYMEFQPQVNSDTGKVYGVESLMRWKHPQIGVIPPPVFISIAEDTGFILELGQWGLEQSISQMSKWRMSGALDTVMSVNVSALQLEDESFPDKLMLLLNKYDLPVDFLKLEITESIALSSQMSRNSVLGKLHLYGIPLAIDDFGMGHSSIIYLKKFPVSSLKVDAVLSRDVLVSRSSREIITSIADLCRSLHINLVVEAVESEEQLLRIRALGCANIQGFFYSRPLSAEACFAFIQQKQRAYGTRKMPSNLAGDTKLMAG